MSNNVYILTSDGELYHWGIKGMKWGVRRYQNKDGSLTEAGRRKLGLSKYDEEHNSDVILRKGTRASRVVSTPGYYEFSDPAVGGNSKMVKKYLDDVMAKEKGYEQKYLSVDNVRNSGRANGKEYYLSWFTDGGWAPNDALLTMYELKKDVRVASGKQVVDALLEEVGPKRIRDMLKENRTIRSLTLEYTTDKALFDRVNRRFADKGYDAIEDINDLDTDMPIITLNSSQSIGDSVSVQSGKDAIDDILKNRRRVN